MKPSQRQAIEEVLALVCRIRNKAVAKAIAKTKAFPVATGLPDVSDGLDISIAKLQILLLEDSCDSAKAKRLKQALADKITIGKEAVRICRCDAMNVALHPTMFNLDAPYLYGKEVQTLSIIKSAKKVVEDCVKSKRNPVEGLRGWVDSWRRAARVLSINVPQSTFMARLAAEEGIKQACIVIEEVLDFDINVSK